MPNSIPLTFRAAPFPEGYKADPEQLKNDIVARLYAESTEAISFFAAGSVAPSSNVGPWLNNGLTWYVWSDGLAMYVPQELAPESLGYIASASAPDPTIYTFWIELNGSGQAISIQYYFSGAWHDIYEIKFATFQTTAAMSSYSTTAQMDAAIAAAVAAIPSVSSYPAQAELTSGPQPFNLGAAASKCTLNLAPVNPAPAPFSTVLFRYIAPAAGIYEATANAVFSVNTGVAAGMEITLRLYINSADTGVFAFNGTPSPNGDLWTLSIPPLPLSLSLNDYIEFYAEATDGVDAGILHLTNLDAGFKRISA